VEKEKQHRFSVSCCGQGRALPILVLVGRVGRERESSVIRSHTSKAEEGQGKHSSRDGRAGREALQFDVWVEYSLHTSGKTTAMQSDDDKQTTKGGEVRGGRLEPQPQELDTVILPVTKQRPITEEPGPCGPAAPPVGTPRGVLHKAPGTSYLKNHTTLGFGTVGHLCARGPRTGAQTSESPIKRPVQCTSRKSL
jgi:hypothetical protein